MVEGSQMENIPAANEAKCCVEVESQQDSFQDDQISVSDMLKYKDWYLAIFDVNMSKLTF